MRVLLTRPQEDSEQLARRLNTLGHKALISPALEIRLLDGPEIRFGGVQAILATSANGVRGLSRRTAERDVPVFAVGQETAGAATVAGFVRVRTAGGTALALADSVRTWADPERGPLLYAAGQQRRSDLEEGLHGAGFSVRTEVLYDAAERPTLSREATAALQSGEIEAVMLFSPRSAAIFSKQVQAAGLARLAAKLIACFISRATAEAGAGLEFAAIRIAAHPDQSGMLALLN